MKLRLLPLAFALVVLGACDKKPAESTTAAPAAGTPAAASAAADPAPAASAPATPEAPATAPVASTGEALGIAECDEFLAKYEACVNDRIPAESRAAFQQSLTATREGWKQAIAAGGRDTLAQACTTMREQTKASLSAYGCTDL